ncbi:MAG: Gfo/Idh/MocA family protein [Hyphomicrobiaceae bacterium]
MIDVAVVGYGWWGQHIARRLQQSEKLTIRYVVEPQSDHHPTIEGQGLTALASLDEVLGDAEVDAVVITTPNGFHEAQVCAAAAAGKHVYCEKPLGLTAASARRSLLACEKAGVTLGVGHERRHEPALRALHRMIKADELGVVMHAEAAFSHDKLSLVPAGDWRTSATLSPAAGMTAMGVHLTDLFISYFGRVRTVQALTAHRTLDWETGDVVTVQLQFDAGMTATLSAILKTPHFIRTHVFGSLKWVEVRSDTHPDTPGGITEATIMQSGVEPVVERHAWRDTVADNLEAFGAAIRGEAPFPISPFEMLHNIEVLEAIARSASTHQTVELSRSASHSASHDD